MTSIEKRAENISKIDTISFWKGNDASSIHYGDCLKAREKVQRL